MTKRRKKAQPSTPADIAAGLDIEPRVKDTPSGLILRQLLRAAHEPASVAAVERFRWSTSQLTRLRRAEIKRDSLDRKAQANGVAEIARLMEERDAEIARIDREARDAEIVNLADMRGDLVDLPASRPGEARKPMVRRSGLEWLRRKERINFEQHTAGVRYADDYRRATEVSLKSCLSSSEGGGSGLHDFESREEANIRLRGARFEALRNHPRMVWLCDQICGEGRTIRQLSGDSDGEAQQNEAALVIALDLLGRHYGIVKECAPALSI